MVQKDFRTKQFVPTFAVTALVGAGTAFGAVVGAALIEAIRNSLIRLGISTFRQGSFVGSFIIIAVAIERLRSLRQRE